jgi:hypothetical protein
MINNNIPGTYYFFAGEEPTAKNGGLYGSRNALNNNPRYFQKFKRAICFDRKAEGSIITRQMARYTCSTEFVDSLIESFSNLGLNFKPDETGWYTDTAVFIDHISEVTNISSGTYKEHTVDEYVDLNYVEKMCRATIMIDWESLPIVRIPKAETTIENGLKKTSDFRSFFKSKKDKIIFNEVNRHLDKLDFLCLNINEFDSGVKMIFSKWHKELRLIVVVKDRIIYVNDKKIGDLQMFKKIFRETRS